MHKSTSLGQIVILNSHFSLLHLPCANTQPQQNRCLVFSLAVLFSHLLSTPKHLNFLRT